MKNLLVTLSQFSEVKPVAVKADKENAKPRFVLNMRAEVGTSEFTTAFMRENNGARPSAEAAKTHEKWVGFYVFSEDESQLTKLLNKLRHGKQHSLLFKSRVELDAWVSTYTDAKTNVTRQAENYSIQTSLLDIYNRDAKEFVPFATFLSL